MFIHDFVHVDQPYPVVRARLVGVGSWLGSLAGEAYADGEDLRLRLGPFAGRRLGARAVNVHLGTPYARGDGVVIPMSWVATRARGLFPSMEADLEAGPLGGEMTQLSLSGMYDPPFGRLGEAVDALLLHTVGEATIRSFLTRIAGEVESPPATPALTVAGGSA